MDRIDGPRRRRQLAMHAARVSVFVAILALIRAQHQRHASQSPAPTLADVELATVQPWFPQAASMGGAAAALGGRQVLGESGEVLGYVVQTSPQSDHIIGFSGPTNVLIGFDGQNCIQGISILSSGDTRDHVEQVRRNEQFMHALDGATWDQAAAPSGLDAVSGATLTSLALREAIARRLGGDSPSLRFPQPLTVQDARQLFAAADDIARDDAHRSLWRVKDAKGAELGQILRSSPSSDNIIGYQGPSDVLIAFDLENRLAGIAVGKSYDNQPYVSYVRDDKYFFKLFQGLTLSQLARLDLAAAGVEGVSGATMTSMAVAEALVRAAADHRQAMARAAQARGSRYRVTTRDLGTAAVVLLGAVIGLTHWRTRKAVRIAFQLLLIGYLGLVNGDMLSQAMLVGWAQHGVPWRSATGLALLTATALLSPIATRKNLYCWRLCPHGAVQQLVSSRLPWRLPLPRRVRRVLAGLPALLLGWCVLVAMLALPFSLVDIEPFDAWVFRVAGGATVTVALVGLAASLFTPMAYCRFGCPTGAMLEYLRLHAHSDRWTRRDAFAVALAAAALVLFVFP